MFYQVDQNNSGGYFDVDDKVCHRLFIEADSYVEAKLKAENLGCYWDGVYNGIDCPCCGDRWYGVDKVNLEKLKEYRVNDYGTRADWFKKYGKYKIIEKPIHKIDYFSNWTGVISFSTIEEYAQYLATEYGWTTPDVRIYYKDGTVKEIFREV